ncbi:hypothetical protein [Staphylospora marina]|uniref:hypothetical protein n=1 Tax=Staphylospora marina TaxID=2490858 RepID=UPI000F5BA22A|nr:hypothetical protein [Staphylospora marina]
MEESEKEREREEIGMDAIKQELREVFGDEFERAWVLLKVEMWMTLAGAVVFVVGGFLLPLEHSSRAVAGYSVLLTLFRIVWDRKMGESCDEKLRGTRYQRKIRNPVRNVCMLLVLLGGASYFYRSFGTGEGIHLKDML